MIILLIRTKNGVNKCMGPGKITIECKMNWSKKLYKSHQTSQCQSQCVTLDEKALGAAPICPICVESVEREGKKFAVAEDLLCCQMPTCLHLKHFTKPDQTRLFAAHLVDIEEMINSKFDGYCQFPVSLASFNSLSSVTLDFQFCAPLKPRYHLHQTLQGI